MLALVLQECRNDSAFRILLTTCFVLRFRRFDFQNYRMTFIFQFISVFTIILWIKQKLQILPSEIFGSVEPINDFVFGTLLSETSHIYPKSIFCISFQIKEKITWKTAVSVFQVFWGICIKMKEMGFFRNFRTPLTACRLSTENFVRGNTVGKGGIRQKYRGNHKILAFFCKIYWKTCLNKTCCVKCVTLLSNFGLFFGRT